MKRLLLFLTMALTLFGVNAADTTVTIEASKLGVANQTSIDGKEITEGDVTLKFTKNSGTTAPTYYDAGGIRFYGGNKMEATVPQGYTFEKIEFTTSSSNSNWVTTTDPTVTNGNLAGKTITANPGVNSITFVNGGTSGHTRIEKIDITYTTSGPSRTPVTLTFIPSNAKVELNGAAPTLKLQIQDNETGDDIEDAPITYTTDNEELISISGNSYTFNTGKTGTAKLTATLADNDLYVGNSATFEYEVWDPSITAYTIEFNTGSGDGTQIAASTNIDNIVSKGKDYISSFSGFASAYYNSSNGLKFGASSSAGKLTINLSDLGKKKATSIVLNCASYGSDSNVGVKVNGFTKTIPSSTLTDLAFDYSNPTEIDKIEIEATASSKNRFYVKGITVIYDEGDPTKSPAEISFGEEDTYTVVKDKEPYELPTLNNPNSLKISYDSSDKSVATVDDDGKVTVLNYGSTIISAKSEATDDFNEGNASYTLVVTPGLINVAKAIEITNAGYTGIAQVEGIISQIQSYSDSYKSITYYISDDGETTNQLQVYGGFGLDGAKFNSKEDIEVGYCVIVEGNLKIYSNAPEIDANSIMLKYEAPDDGREEAEMEFDQEEYTFVIGQPFTSPVVKHATDADIVYSSANDKVAKVNESTGELELVSYGETVITATAEENEHYRAGKASYNLIVVDPSIKSYTIVFNGNNTQGDGNAFQVTTFTSDDNTNWTKLVDIENSDDCIESITISGDVYPAGNYGGLRLGKSGTTGKVSVNLKDNWNVNVLKYEIEVKKYGNDSDVTMKFNDSEFRTNDSEFTVYLFDDFEDEVADEVSVETTTNGKRAYVKTITIFYKPIDITVNTKEWDEEWEDNLLLEGLAFTIDGEDATGAIDKNEILFTFEPLFAAEPAETDATKDDVYSEITEDEYDFEGDALLVQFPCSGLYNVVANANTGYTVNGQQSAVVGTANIYPSMEGLTLSYVSEIDGDDVKKGDIREFEIGKDDYQFEIMTEETDKGIIETSWYFENCKKPKINVTGDNVEIWYRITGLEDVKLPKKEENESEPKEIRRAGATDSDLDGYTQVGEDGTIDLTMFAYAKDEAPQLSLILKKNNASTPIESGTTNGQSKQTIDLTKADNITTGVDEVIGAEEAEAEYYTLQGVKVQNPDKGIYIVKIGGKTSKVVL